MTDPTVPTHPADPSDPTGIPLFRTINGQPPAPQGPINGRRTAADLAGPIDRTLPQHPLAAAAPPRHRTNPATPPAIVDWPAEGRYLVNADRLPHTPAQLTGLDWRQVALLRSQASEQLTAALGEERANADRDTEQELGRAIIQELLASTVADRIHSGEEPWTLPEQDAMAEAVFNALFGLGRLQPYVDDDTVENIIIAGYNNVWLERTDGSLTRAEPVADSDSELLDFLAFVASRSEVNARSFSSANPQLHMKLDGGARLAAAAWVTAYPSVVIRRHRLRRVTLDDLVERRMMTRTTASFLRAAIRAHKSVVVSGAQGAGKTTLLRALCAEIYPWEAIGTFETEFELLLHELPDVHPIVHAWEGRPGSGELTADGKQAGAFSLHDALDASFRFNLSRQIVGECRGPESWAMIKAMESGSGSISTTHSANAEGAIRKLVTCAMEAGSHITRDLATSKLAEAIDLIVHVNLQTEPQGEGWRRTRWISEIIHLTPGEAPKGYATTHVFRPNPGGGPALAGTLPDELRSLAHLGFDLDTYLAESGQEAA